MPSSTSCVLPKLELMFDMSGMISCCQHSTYWLRDNNGKYYNARDNLQEVWDSESRRSWVSRLEAGEPVPECAECWTKEALGVTSIRQHFNHDYNNIEPRADQPRVISIKPGIGCNSACRSCNERTSATWFKDAFEFDRDNNPALKFKSWLRQWQPHVTIYKDNGQLEQTFDRWQEHMIFWDIYGGEPLTIPLSYRIISGAYRAGFAHQQTLQIHTNGTVYDSDLAHMLTHYRSVNFAVSIDGVGAKNDYLRHPSEFGHVIDVLSKYREDFASHANVNFYIRYTATPLSVWDLDEYCDYFNHLGIPYRLNNYAVDEPHNNIQYMPADIKQKVFDHLHRLQHFDMENLLKFMQGTPADHREHQMAFWKHNSRLDQLRNQSFADVFPEWHQVWADWIVINGGPKG
jgi:hypothetical protein